MKLLKLFSILKTSSFFLGEKMANPMKLRAEKEPDLDLLYDFDSMSLERKSLLNIFFLASVSFSIPCLVV